MADKISERRGQANRFYISILTGLFALFTFIEKVNVDDLNERRLFLVAGILGLLLCVIWWFNIKSYRQLNTGKFKTLHDLEKHLPYQFYRKEWELLGEGKEIKKYYQLTKVEQFTPLLVGVLYLVLVIFSLL